MNLDGELTVQFNWVTDIPNKASSPPPGLRKNPPLNSTSGFGDNSYVVMLSNKIEIIIVEKRPNPLSEIRIVHHDESSNSNVVAKTVKTLQQFLQFYNSFILDHRLQDTLQMDLLLGHSSADNSHMDEESIRFIIEKRVVKFFQGCLFLFGYPMFLADPHIKNLFIDNSATLTATGDGEYLISMIRHWQSLIDQAQALLVSNGMFESNTIGPSSQNTLINRDSMHSLQSATTQQSLQSASRGTSSKASELGDEEDFSLHTGKEMSLPDNEKWLMTTCLNTSLFRELLTSNTDFYQLLDLLVQMFDSISQHPSISQSIQHKVHALVNTLEHNPNKVYFQTDSHCIDMALLDDPLIITGVASSDDHLLKMKEDVASFLLLQTSLTKKMMPSPASNLLINFDPKAQSACGKNFQGTIGMESFIFGFNNFPDVALLLLMDEIGTIVGRGNLFHLSVKLIRAWWKYDTACYGNHAIRDLLSVNAFHVMIASVFHQYAHIITSPLHAFCLFLAEYSNFDPKNQVITIEGLKPVLSEVEIQDRSLPKSGLIGKSILDNFQSAMKQWQKFSLVSTEFEPYISGSDQLCVVHPITGENMVKLDCTETDEVTQLMAIFKAGALRTTSLLKNCLQSEGSFGSLKILFESTISRYDNYFQSVGGVSALPSSLVKDCFLDAHLSLVQCFHFSLFTASGTLTLDALEVYSRELLSASDIPLRASDIFGEVLPRLSATSRISAVDSSIFSDLAALLLKNTRLFRAVDNNLVDPLVVLVDQASSSFSKDGQYGSCAAQIINETPQSFLTQQSKHIVGGRQIMNGAAFSCGNANFPGKSAPGVRNPNPHHQNIRTNNYGGHGNNNFSFNAPANQQFNNLGIVNKHRNFGSNNNRSGYRINSIGSHQGNNRNTGQVMSYGQLPDSSLSQKDEETLRQQHNSWLDGF